jgi:hypothetical protein
MTAHSTIAHPNLTSTAAESVSLEIGELRSPNLRQRIEALLRKVFEGHEEFLGWTPD